MNTQQLLTTVAAVLLASTTGGLFHHSASLQLTGPTEINGSPVVNLAPVMVHPLASDRRTAALLPTRQAPAGDFMADDMTVKTTHHVLSYSLVGSQLAMPYYSFSNASGRISKE